MIVGTAGHVDHGKTSLVKALTGVDTDRLPEEKRRGITLELGFAHWELPSKRVVGVVDVPGHERFIKAMAAGAGGVDVAMLVVAADEGVMPQTREHVDICTLLGVRAGVLVVSKADLLPELDPGQGEWLGLLEAELRALVVGTPFEGAPLCAVSSKTGEGLAELTRAVDAQCAALEKAPVPGRGADAPVLLPIDRAFTVKGFGAVVTGTLWSGRLGVGEELALMPAQRPCRVRGVQVHGQAVESALAGTRVAVNVPDLSLDDVSRGHALSRAGELSAVTSAEAALSVLPAESLGKRTRLRATVGTAQVDATVHLLPGGEGARRYARLSFSQPIAALPGQRFILRSTRAGTATVAGGTLLVINPPRRRKEAGQRAEAYEAAPLEERLRLLLVDAGYAGLDEKALAARAQASLKDVARALEVASAKGAVVVVERGARGGGGAGLPSPGPSPQGERGAGSRSTLAAPGGNGSSGSLRVLVAAEVLQALAARVLVRLEALHHANAERAGFPREELRQRLGEPPDKVLHRVLEQLAAAKKLELDGEQVRLPGRGRVFTEAVSARQRLLLEALEKRQLSPPTLSELGSTLRATEAEVVAAGQALVAAGAAVKAGELFFARSAIAALERRLIEWFATHERLSTQDFKELTGLSRKFLIPLAEYFDRERLTLRVGDERVLRKR